ncbi:MAG: hypothetical protein P8125_04745 [Gemmatimonadota bacterium]
MKRFSLLAVLSIVILATVFMAGRASAVSEVQETNYLVIESFELGPDQTINQEIERLSEWVRILRNTGKHSSVRLFMHHWGPETALYIMSETSDWGAIGTMVDDLFAEIPEFMDQEWGFAGHSDNILTEIPVE